MNRSDVKFADLVKIEPALGTLELDVRAVKPTADFCANQVWYGYFGSVGFKERLMKLVGWLRGIIPGTGIPARSEDGTYTMAALAANPTRWTPAHTDSEKLLRSSIAYDVAYDHLYALLPDCQCCGMICGGMTVPPDESDDEDAERDS